MKKSIAQSIKQVVNNLPNIETQICGKIVLENNYLYIQDESGKISIDGIPHRYVGSTLCAKGTLKISSYEQKGMAFFRLFASEFEVKERAEAYDKFMQEIEKLMTKRTHRDFIEYFRSILKNQNSVRLLLIHGKSAQTHQDFLTGLKSSAGEHFNLLEIEMIETPLRDAELSKALSQYDPQKHDAVFVVRGGGPSEDLMLVGGDLCILEVLRKDIPLFVALGHSFDVGLSPLERVANYAFATPSLAGAQLGSLLRNLIALEKTTQSQQCSFSQMIGCILKALGLRR
ncbi:MAG: hypothetical protein NZL90_00845 [Aquificaceae bacterium]|nr:hypothetical protein [Aquificaceae bacterium]MDW8237239.1 exodeoxyribonuclease VII large subunit [Aquificaceae bacterium]